MAELKTRASAGESGKTVVVELIWLFIGASPTQLAFVEVTGCYNDNAVR